jgi:uncharacterized protein YbbC (DUF1343 family)
MPDVIPGCEVLMQRAPKWLKQAKLGILAHQASVTRGFRAAQEVIMGSGGRVICLFSPQHGYHSDRQANMIETSDQWDTAFSIPVYSLYSEIRQPSRGMLEAIDVLIIDLQDVGARVYTYGASIGLCVEAAAGLDLKVVILDRPNPINGAQVEGNVLAPGFESFVGRYEVPMRHGLTMGELARFVVREKHLDVDLEVMPAEGWRRSDFFPDTSLPWIFPSPNMPTWETALLYPGMVLLEGTNVSEGRGTTLPFQLFGAPFVNQRAFHARLQEASLPGVVFRPVCFEPVFDKWKGELCLGFQLHVTDRVVFQPYLTALVILQAFLSLHPEGFRWLPPPYEYEYEKMPIDILLGDGGIRRELERGVGPREIEQAWLADLSSYEEARQGVLLYP